MKVLVPLLKCQFDSEEARNHDLLASYMYEKNEIKAAESSVLCMYCLA